MSDSLEVTAPRATMPSFEGLDEAAAHQAIDAAVAEHVHPDHQFLARLALRTYFEVWKQGANEIETVSTVYHAGMTHIREAMGMPFDQAAAVLNDTHSDGVPDEVRAAVIAALINAMPIHGKDGAQVGVTLKLALDDATALRAAMLRAERVTAS